MKFTYYGHACFAIETMGKTLLVDPFISPNPLAKHIDVNAIKADYILVSHGHGDHVADLVSIAQRTGATVVGNYEVVNWAKRQGVEKIHAMNFGPYNFEFGKLYLTQAAHSSSMPDGTYGGCAGGFLLNNEEGRWYYSGDTCLTMEMEVIPMYGELNFVILPIGGNFTMDVSDAIKATEMIECGKVIGVHYNTFDPIKIDTAKAVQQFKDAGCELILTGIGETINV